MANLRYKATPTTFADGDLVDGLTDVNGRQIVVATSGSGASSNQVQGTAADNAAAVGNPVLSAGKYNSSAPTYDNGDVAVDQMDVNGNKKVREQYVPGAEDNINGVIATSHKPVASSAYSGTAFMQALNDVDISVKASAGNILSVTASNINAAVRYLQIHNKASAPANPEVPILSFAIPAGTATAPGIREVGREFLGEHGHYLSTGIAIGISTTAATFTAATTTDHIVNGTFV